MKAAVLQGGEWLSDHQFCCCVAVSAAFVAAGSSSLAVKLKIIHQPQPKWTLLVLPNRQLLKRISVVYSWGTSCPALTPAWDHYDEIVCLPVLSPCAETAPAHCPPLSSSSSRCSRTQGGPCCSGSCSSRAQVWLWIGAQHSVQAH